MTCVVVTGLCSSLITAVSKSKGLPLTLIYLQYIYSNRNKNKTKFQIINYNIRDNLI